MRQARRARVQAELGLLSLGRHEAGEVGTGTSGTGVAGHRGDMRQAGRARGRAGRAGRGRGRGLGRGLGRGGVIPKT